MSIYERGSEWRKWDLHVHTKDTAKNDQFTSPDFDSFCVDMFKKALENDIAVIGITDYFNIENYKKVKQFVEDIDENDAFDHESKTKIKQLFILPNVELRMIPVTDSGSLINIHCLFNPDKKFLSSLENDFFSSLEESGGYKMNKDGIISLGRGSESDVSDDRAYKKGINTFHLDPGQLRELFNKHTVLEANTIIAVSNSSNDGASGLQEHYRLFENEPGSTSEIRRTIYKLSNAIFSGNLQDRDFFLGKKEGHDQQTVISECGSLKPCIHGSDAHCEDKLFNPDQNRFCWIKADPTFEGLKQIIYEPEHRIYIGEEPSFINKVRNNKTRYINTLAVNQKHKNHTGDTWFKDIAMPFNKELVAIIGNKGSGKSGIADILGLVGYAHTDKKHYSFLNKNKFLKNKLANKFNAQIIWESGGKSSEICLGEDIKTEKPESVRFIPQNYFEELTNELEISKFQHVLENIIFSYIPDAEKLNKSDFEELEKYKTESVNRDIQTKKIKIQNINNEIIELEKKKHPDYLSKVKGLIEQKGIDIKAQEDLLNELPHITNPNNGNKITEQQNENIAKHSIELDNLKDELKKKELEKSNATSKIESLKQLKTRIEQQKQLLDDFLQTNSTEAEKYQLDIRKILKVKTDYSSIDKLIRDVEMELANVETYLESAESIEEKNTKDNNNSIVYKIKILTDKINTETEKLTGEEKAFQKNEQQKKIINERIQELTGANGNPTSETLNYYLKEQDFIVNNLPGLLEEKRNKRVEESLGIFNKKSEILELYDAFKKSVDEQILQNKDLLEGYDIKIDSSFNLDTGFYDEFLGYINQGKRGCFHGKDEGKNKIKTLIDDNGFSDENNIKKLLESIIASLDENNAGINEQVNKGKLNDFYDYVFSLDYIKPKYELKLGGKILSQLSPGERGALLLIFYLMIDIEEIPLVIDQPEDNLDNESVYRMLSKFIVQAKQKRQIIMVTHNPNLAVGADAEQIIHVNIDKINKNKFSFYSGSIENPKINQQIVRILEGTKPAFDKRKLKYQERITNDQPLRHR